MQVILIRQLVGESKKTKKNKIVNKSWWTEVIPFNI